MCHHLINVFSEDAVHRYCSSLIETMSVRACPEGPPACLQRQVWEEASAGAGVPALVLRLEVPLQCPEEHACPTFSPFSFFGAQSSGGLTMPPWGGARVQPLEGRFTPLPVDRQRMGGGHTTGLSPVVPLKCKFKAAERPTEGPQEEGPELFISRLGLRLTGPALSALNGGQ